MTWAFLDDHADENDKLLDAGAEAAWYWACGLCFCRRKRISDGVIRSDKALTLYPVKSPRKVVKRLVEVGLWDVVDGGYQIHDYGSVYGVSAARSAAGIIGGKRSVESRRASEGTAQPRSKPKQNFEANPEAKLSEAPKQTGKQTRSKLLPKHGSGSGSDLSERVDLKTCQVGGETQPGVSPPPDPEWSRVLHGTNRADEQFMGRGPGSRADVQQIHTEWARVFERPAARFRNPFDLDAKIIAEAIDAHGLPACMLVLRHARADGMVSGKQDDKGMKHESVAYIFGNTEAFTRIHRDGSKREGKAGRGRDAFDVVAAGKAL